MSSRRMTDIAGLEGYMRAEIRRLIEAARAEPKPASLAGIKCPNLAELWPVAAESCTTRSRKSAQSSAGFYDVQIWRITRVDNCRRYLSVPAGIRRPVSWDLVSWRARPGHPLWRVVPWYDSGDMRPFSPRAVITASSQPESPAELD